MAAAHATSSSGSMYKPASPATSGNAELRLRITGVPLAIASSTGRPKPSYSEGNSNRRAPANSSAKPLSS
ncbi:hypothetical protein D3C84_1243740 [compost metagenome]